MAKILVTAALLFFFINGIAQPSADLKKSVAGFTLAVSDIKKDKETYSKILRLYIDPAANVDSLVTDYYEHWKRNYTDSSYAIKTELKSITYNNDKTRAAVEIENIWHMPNGDKHLLISGTTWVYKNGVWYRSGEIATVLENRKL